MITLLEFVHMTNDLDSGGAQYLSIHIARNNNNNNNKMIAVSSGEGLVCFSSGGDEGDGK